MIDKCQVVTGRCNGIMFLDKNTFANDFYLVVLFCTTVLVKVNAYITSSCNLLLHQCAPSRNSLSGGSVPSRGTLLLKSTK